MPNKATNVPRLAAVVDSNVKVPFDDALRRILKAPPQHKPAPKPARPAKKRPAKKV